MRRVGPLFMMDRMTTQLSPVPVRATGSRSPFVRLRELIDPFQPGMSPISLAVGEPQHPIPSFVGPVIAKHVAEFGRYPANKGLDEFGKAVADWVGRRFKLERPLDPANEVLVLNGTREGLFLAALAAMNWVTPRQGAPAVLIPNPFYAAYAAGAIGAHCEPVYLPTTRETGFLPDLDALSDELLARTVAFYLASPANPQGAVADLDYLKKLTAMARRFGFMIFSDECYCEIYSEHAPHGMLEAAGSDFANVAIFHSLVEAIEPAGIAHRLCRRRPLLHAGVSRIAQCRGADGADADAACRDRRLQRRKARRGKPAALSREIRSCRSDHRRPLRLQAAGGRLFPVARRVGPRRQRGGDAEAVA